MLKKKNDVYAYRHAAARQTLNNIILECTESHFGLESSKCFLLKQVNFRTFHWDIKFFFLLYFFPSLQLVLA